MKPLELNASQTAKLAELAPILEGKPDVTKIAEIDLERLAREFRMQKIVFETARDVYDQMQKNWKGSKEFLLAQLVRLVEQFIGSGKISITPALFHQDDLKRRLIITLNMTTRGTAYLGGDPLREHRSARAGLRPGPPDPLNRRHGDLVHRQAVRIHEALAYQFLRL